MPARTKLKWSQLKVGILVAVCLAILVVGIFALTRGGSWFAPTFKLYTYVPDAGGMRPGASVNLEGVNIGNVIGVHLAEHPPDPNNPVEVVMQVSGNHQRWLRKNSTVELGTAGPLGETLVNISAGTLAAPPATNGTVLMGAPSTGISQLMVTSHSVLSNAVSLESRLGQILDQIQKGNGAIGRLIYSNEFYNHLDAAVGNLQTLTNNLNKGEGTAGKLLTDATLYNKLNATLDNVNGFLAQVEHGQGTMAKLINDPSLYNNANGLMASVKKTTDDLNSGQGALGALMTNSPTSAKLKDALVRLDAVLAEIQAGKGTMGKLMVDPSLYNNLNDLSTQTKALIRAIRTNPKKYLTIHLDIF